MRNVCIAERTKEAGLAARTTCTAVCSSSGVGLLMAFLICHTSEGSTMVTSPSHGWLTTLSQYLGRKSGRIMCSCRHLQGQQTQHTRSTEPGDEVFS